MSNEEEKTPDLTKRDWTDIHFTASHTSYDQKILTEYLGCEFSKISRISRTLSPYQQIICRAVLEDFIEMKGYKITDKRDWYSDGLTVFTDGEIEIAPSEFKKVPEDGYLFLEKDNSARMVMSINNIQNDKYRINLASSPNDGNIGQEFLDELLPYAKEHNVLKGKVITPSFSHVKVSKNYSWDSVVLPILLKREIQTNVQSLINNIDVYKANNLVFKRGLILKGVPGTGKTMILKVLCNELKGTSIIWVTPGDLDGLSKVKLIGELARELSPSILMLEDIDLYAAHREQGDKQLIGELMNQLDGLVENEFVVVIATTNRAEEIEEAIRNRPGRFDRSIEIFPPDVQCREQMLKLFLQEISVKVENREKLIAALATLTDGFTGAHVKFLVNAAVSSAIDRKSLDENGKVVLSVDDFKNNLERVKVFKIVPAGFSSEKGNSDRVRTLQEMMDDDDDF